MSRRLSTDPADRMGVYKSLADVPDRYRLGHHSGAYAGRDVWAEYVAEHLAETYPDASERFHRDVDNCGERWRAHMADRDRHHALARPVDVEEWIDALLADRTVGTVYAQYWVRIEEFYGWLQAHGDHPHVYHPVLMAAAGFDAARSVWQAKVNGATSRRGGHA